MISLHDKLLSQDVCIELLTSNDYCKQLSLNIFIPLFAVSQGLADSWSYLSGLFGARWPIPTNNMFHFL